MGDTRRGPRADILRTTAVRPTGGHGRATSHRSRADGHERTRRESLSSRIEGTHSMIKLYSFFESFLASTRDEEGQTMAEYAIILAVIVVAVLATLALLAGGINTALSSVTSKL